MYEYPSRGRVQRPRAPRAPRAEVRREPVQHTPATVVTVVEPGVRARVDAVLPRSFRSVHASSVAEALIRVSDRSVRALLISPAVIRREPITTLVRLVDQSPVALPVAVISSAEASVGEGLLALGACGVRRSVDLTGLQGWSRLRSCIEEAENPAAARFLEAVTPVLGEASEGARRFFAELVRFSPQVTSVQALTKHLNLSAATLVSRFHRRGLPSVKRYLVTTRLVLAAGLLETPGASVRRVSDRLEYSSPQSFGRHVRTMLRVSANAFRSRYSLAAMLDYYIEQLVVPYREALRDFDPFDLRTRQLAVSESASGRAPRESR